MSAFPHDRTVEWADAEWSELSVIDPVPDDRIMDLLYHAPAKWRHMDAAWTRAVIPSRGEDVLAWAVRLGPKGWASAAYALLAAKKGLRPMSLSRIIIGAPPEYSSRAWDCLLLVRAGIEPSMSPFDGKPELNNEDLRMIMRYAHDEWKEKAGDAIISSHPSEKDLACVVEFAKGETRKTAKKLLAKKKKEHEEFAKKMMKELRDGKAGEEEDPDVPAADERQDNESVEVQK